MEQPNPSLLARLEKIESLAARLLQVADSSAASLFTMQWTGPLVNGAQTIAAQTSKILCDPTNGNVVLSFQGNAAPADQSIVLLKDYTGQSQVHPITLAAPTGWTIEEPQNQGNFGATASMTAQGGAWAFQAIAGTTKKLVLIWTA